MKLSPSRFHTEADLAGQELRDRVAERREQRIRFAMTALPEIPRGRLEFRRYLIVDTATNELFTVVRGEVEAKCTPATTYFLAEDGSPVFLERHAARTLDALEAKRDARKEAAAERMRPRTRG